MDLREMYSDLIKEHSASGHNRRTLARPTHSEAGHNPSCGDEIVLQLQVEDDLVRDVAFTGVGCAISQASVSIMADLVRGKPVAEALRLSQLFLAMSRGEALEDEQLEELDEAAALSGVATLPARVKCATMPWHTLVKALEAL